MELGPREISRIINYYKNREVMQAMLEHARHKEIGLRMRNGTFAKRPQILQYDLDILEAVKRGVTSFHASEELWSNPLLLSSTISKREMDELRIGWDLVLDIDCKEFEYSRIAAIETIKQLKSFGVKNISVKFSGNKGFHIGIPFESFPKTMNDKPLKYFFPEAPRRIALMITNLIKRRVGEKILKFEKGNIEVIAEKTGVSKEELIKEKKVSDISILEIDIDSFMGKILNIDTILIAPRHLYRMPYSIHEKSLLVSLPIRIDDLEEFKKEEAIPENVKVKHKFIDRSKSIPNEAEELLRMALVYIDESTIKEKSSSINNQERITTQKIVSRINENFFPPCISKGLKGLIDGRKRFLFILINFLRYMNWSKEEIIEKINEWNKLNNEPLRETYIKSQINYAFRKEAILPPNCDKKDYYKDIGICSPDSLCQKIRNPVTYARFLFLKEKKKKKKGEGASRNSS